MYDVLIPVSVSTLDPNSPYEIAGELVIASDRDEEIMRTLREKYPDDSLVDLEPSRLFQITNNLLGNRIRDLDTLSLVRASLTNQGAMILTQVINPAEGEGVR